jgi:hypothetical protein
VCGFGAAVRQRVNKNASRLQTTKEGLERRTPTLLMQFQDQQLAEIIFVQLTPHPVRDGW